MHKEPLFRITHDIIDQNYTIVMGADLLKKYWEELYCCLDQAGRDEGVELGDDYREILATVPQVIEGIRTASRRIDGIIREAARQKDLPADPSSPGEAAGNVPARP